MLKTCFSRHKIWGHCPQMPPVAEGLQCKWTFTQPFILSTPLVCAGHGQLTLMTSWSFHWPCKINKHCLSLSCLVLVEVEFSIFCLKCFLHFSYQQGFLFINCLINIHFFKHFLQTSHNLRKINDQN